MKSFFWHGAAALSSVYSVTVCECMLISICILNVGFLYEWSKWFSNWKFVCVCVHVCVFMCVDMCRLACFHFLSVPKGEITSFNYWPFKLVVILYSHISWHRVIISNTLFHLPHECIYISQSRSESWILGESLCEPIAYFQQFLFILPPVFSNSYSTVYSNHKYLRKQLNSLKR